eukprot:TRINITY_DN26766_c0_g1_i1.p1 TRINITY_DN26766_c0_g1~~TRINITY_DN26766_c0_g1_i1.p1  ORF type:complete len:303 (+),score=106.50 TRINITY_DN26766_c0_g1_i1:28-909(+)
MVRVVLGYMILNGHPKKAVVSLGGLQVVVACREHVMCILVCSEDTPRLRWLASDIADAFELVNALKMPRFKDIEDARNEEASAMKTDQIISDTTGTPSRFTPHTFPSLDEFRDFESVIKTYIKHPAATAYGILNELAHSRSVTVCALLNTSLTDPFLITCSATLNTGQPGDDSLTLSGLYAPPCGVLWQMVLAKYTAEKEPPTLTVTFSDAKATYVNAHLAHTGPIYHEGALTPAVLVAFIALSPTPHLTFPISSTKTTNTPPGYFTSALDNLQALPKPSTDIRNPLDPLRPT